MGRRYLDPYSPGAILHEVGGKVSHAREPERPEAQKASGESSLRGNRPNEPDEPCGTSDFSPLAWPETLPDRRVGTFAGVPWIVDTTQVVIDGASDRVVSRGCPEYRYPPG
jgi:hypothetical protein